MTRRAYWIGAGILIAAAAISAGVLRTDDDKPRARRAAALTTITAPAPPPLDCTSTTTTFAGCGDLKASMNVLYTSLQAALNRLDATVNAANSELDEIEATKRRIAQERAAATFALIVAWVNSGAAMTGASSAALGAMEPQKASSAPTLVTIECGTATAETFPGCFDLQAAVSDVNRQLVGLERLKRAIAAMAQDPLAASVKRRQAAVDYTADRLPASNRLMTELARRVQAFQAALG
jgi:hypothetical protein